MEQFKILGLIVRATFILLISIFGTQAYAIESPFEISEETLIDADLQIYSFKIEVKEAYLTTVKRQYYHFLWKFDDCFYAMGDSVTYSRLPGDQIQIEVLATKKGEEYDDADDPDTKIIFFDDVYDATTGFDLQTNVETGLSRAPRPDFISYILMSYSGTTPVFAVVEKDNKLDFYDGSGCSNFYPVATEDSDGKLIPNDNKQDEVNDFVVGACEELLYLGDITDNKQLYIVIPVEYGVDTLIPLCTPTNLRARSATESIVSIYELDTVNANLTTIKGLTDQQLLEIFVNASEAYTDKRLIFIDSDTVKATVVNSWDPNAKSVVGDTIVEAEEWVTYTIQFENLGDAVEREVIIHDTLSTHFDISTLQITETSHPFQAFEITDGNILSMATEEGMILMSRTTSDNENKGYVTFTVQLKKDVPVGTVIANRALITFGLAGEDVLTDPTYIRVVEDRMVVTPGAEPIADESTGSCGNNCCCCCCCNCLWYGAFLFFLIVITIMLWRLNKKVAKLR